MKRIATLFMVLAPVMALAGEHGSGHTDIVPRTINFIIFVGLAYYLLGDTIKNIFSSRREAIAAEFELAQKKLQESTAMREEAVAKVTAATRLADDIVANARRESELIAGKIAEQAKRDIEMLDKHFEEHKHTEERKMVLRSVESSMKNGLAEHNLGLNDQAIVSILEKKVA